jgi:23S rRNA G2445 N2-methylase RlmL
MLVSKSFLVTGNTYNRNGKQEKDIAANVDKAINDFLKSIDGKGKLVELRPNVQIGPMQDTAFITVIVDVDGRVNLDKPITPPPTSTVLKK